MRNYWLKIALGALGVFLVGLLGVTLARKAKSSVEGTLNSTDPISIPTPFVDFKLDGRRLGEISRVVLLRNDPHHISGVTVVLKMADSLRGSLANCILTADKVDQTDKKSSFRCQTSADTAGQTLMPFGRVAIRGSSDTFALLLPQKAIEGIQRTSFKLNGNDFKISDESDSAQAVNDSIKEVRDSIREAIRDSLSDAAERMSDSMQTATEKMADSLTEAALRKAGSAIKSVKPVPAPKPPRPRVPKPAATTSTP